jgi:peroxidase
LISNLRAFRSCPYFNKKLNAGRKLEKLKHSLNVLLEEEEFIQDDEDLGYARTEIVPCRHSSNTFWHDRKDGDLYTSTARLMSDVDLNELKSFGSYYKCLGKWHRDPKTRPKYRPINGYGNNLKNPYWGSTGAAFGRFGPKNYDDGVHLVKKSLPNPRKLVQNILMKAETKGRLTKIPNDMSNFAGLYITHDMAGQQNEKLPHDKCEDMRCCIRENKGILPNSLRNSACLPIPIPDDDPFYSQYEVKCLNFIRSEKTSQPSWIQFGEIKNKATGFIDLSLVYGNEDSDLAEVRTSDGKLRMNDKNLMAVDATGDYSSISDRMRAVPSTSVWPALFTRNHNKLVDELKRVNPQWTPEQLFQEARRINIAILQSITLDYVDFLFDAEGGLKLNEEYDENVNILSNVEFHSAAYRYFHFYVNSDVLKVKKDGTESTVKLSDTFGNMTVVEEDFDAIINGMFDQSVNLGEYSEEIVNHFAKRETDGVGVDIVSFDIQRGKVQLEFEAFLKFDSHRSRSRSHHLPPGKKAMRLEL